MIVRRTIRRTMISTKVTSSKVTTTLTGQTMPFLELPLLGLALWLRVVLESLVPLLLLLLRPGRLLLPDQLLPAPQVCFRNGYAGGQPKSCDRDCSAGRDCSGGRRARVTGSDSGSLIRIRMKDEDEG